MVPGDGLTYALRDVTATVQSIPLIAASVMSKKVASGTHGVVLDVKHGDGALIPDPALARQLARLMVDIGAEFGLPCRVVLSDMSQPLGRAVGNALEVKEALAALGGQDVPGLTGLCEVIAALMLRIGEPGTDHDTAVRRVRQAIGSGAARAQFLRWVVAQGGAAEQVEQPELLPAAAHRDVVRAAHQGFVTQVRARLVGEAASSVGAGRLRHGDPIDPGAGVVLLCRVGDRVRTGEPLAELHWTDGAPAAAREQLAAAFRIGATPPVPAPGFEVLADPGGPR
ncbi:MAG TPA: thymidine phosphorylase, partial [Micromonosporaceae bacterium]|nr:thymidine phosphorylase [Micromonosporaceae bacterium]